MIYKHLFIDSDVLLDLLLERYPFYNYTQLLLIESTKGLYNLSTSTLVIANINYILSGKITKAGARKSISELTSFLKLLPFEEDAVMNALDSKFDDFEDAIQYSIAQKHNCDAIVTRNIKDYKNSTIPVLTAEQFLSTL